MSKEELQQYLSYLGITQLEAGQLLGVTPRTIRRWIDGEEIPRSIEQVFRAWFNLHKRNLPWRPDSMSIIEDNQDQIAAHRAYAIDLSALLERVEQRGGPKVPWLVNWEKSYAELGPMQVSFHKLQNGGFSLSVYTRRDREPDTQRDWEFIEDAAYCISQSIKKKLDFGPVTLVYTDGPSWVGPDGKFGMMRMEPFETNEEALQRACTLSSASKFYNPFIREGTPTKTAGDGVIWNSLDIIKECQKRRHN